MFYFNILGSNDKNDIKLIAFITDNKSNNKNKFVYLNDNNNTWNNMIHQNKWDFPIQNNVYKCGIDYWVCVFLVCVCKLRYCVKQKNTHKKIKIKTKKTND